MSHSSRVVLVPLVTDHMLGDPPSSHGPEEAAVPCYVACGTVLACLLLGEQVFIQQPVAFPTRPENGRSADTALQLLSADADLLTLRPVQQSVTQSEFIHLCCQKSNKRDRSFYQCSPIGLSPASLILQALSFMDRTVAAR